VAITILQVRPNVQYLSWLAERFQLEVPFLQYHAAVTLLSTARVLDPTHYAAIRAAIQDARRVLEDEKRFTDEWRGPLMMRSMSSVDYSLAAHGGQSDRSGR
jgi:hypothetical protein